MKVMKFMGSPFLMYIAMCLLSELATTPSDHKREVAKKTHEVKGNKKNYIR